ncbi:hypothetical protein GCM10023259_024940 [Thermocatellispora tengchongensis]
MAGDAQHPHLGRADVAEPGRRRAVCAQAEAAALLQAGTGLRGRQLIGIGGADTTSQTTKGPTSVEVRHFLVRERGTGEVFSYLLR